MTNGKKILIAGATGLIGRKLTEQLADEHVTVLVRRLDPSFPSQVKQVIADYGHGVAGLREALEQAGLGHDFDVVACCIGSTMRAAGSQEAFLKIERDIPLLLLQYAASCTKPPLFLFVSSMGAGKPYGFYLQTKASVERAIVASGLPYGIIRPSLLMGERTEHRPGEKFAQKIMPAFFNVLGVTPLKHTSSYWRYRPIEARQIARVMAALARAHQEKSASPGVFEGRVLFEGQ